MTNLFSSCRSEGGHGSLLPPRVVGGLGAEMTMAQAGLLVTTVHECPLHCLQYEGVKAVFLSLSFQMCLQRVNIFVMKEEEEEEKTSAAAESTRPTSGDGHRGQKLPEVWFHITQFPSQGLGLLSLSGSKNCRTNCVSWMQFHSPAEGQNHQAAPSSSPGMICLFHIARSL